MQEQERAVRVLAQEGRTARRALATSLFEIMHKTPADKRGTRVMGPPRPGSAHYVFVILPQADVAEETYRERRRALLHAYCLVLKLVFPEAQDIIGIATEPGEQTMRSQDVIYVDARNWTPEMQAQAALFHAQGLLKKTGPLQRSTILEYPGSE